MVTTAEIPWEPFKAGDEFLQYRIHSLLGRGGHAFVYSGEHRYMERPVAIKVIPAPGAMSHDVYKRARLEAKILSQLEHPNVVKVYDAGVTNDGVIYIVMEILAGRTLRAALRHLGRFSVPEALYVGIQIAEAVQAAHAQNAIHRDLKPENVFVLPDNKIKVLDFGITKFLGANSMTTQPNYIQGTPQYMSPEHMEGRPVTVQSDVFALGSILYELLAAIAPALIGLQEISNFTIGYSQIHRVPPRLDEYVGRIPHCVDRLIQCMLAKTPQERPASMTQVAQELRVLQKRFIAESPERLQAMRELWHEVTTETPRPQTPGSHTAATAVGKVVLTNQVTVAAADLNGKAPAPTQRIENLTPTATRPLFHALMHQDLASQAFSLRRLALAILLGAACGHGVVIAYRHANTQTNGSVQSDVLGATNVTQGLAVKPDANEVMVLRMTSDTAKALHVPQSSERPANSRVATAASARVPWINDVKRTEAKPIAASGAEPKPRAASRPSNANATSKKVTKKQDQLLFGADDLSW